MMPDDAASSLNELNYGVLLLCKLLFLCHYASAAAYSPFIPLFLTSIGGTEAQIGYISAVRPFLGFISMPLVGLAADIIGNHKIVLLLLIGLTGLVRLGLIWCSTLTAAVVLILSTDFFGMPVHPIIDSTVLDTLSDPLQYGRQRLWGTIGYGIMAPIAGQAIAAGGLHAALWIHVVGTLITIIVVSRFRVVRPAASTHSFWSAWRAAVRDAQTICLVFGTVVMGQAYGAIGAFLFLRLQELGGSPLLMGLTLAVNCAVEAPVFHFSAAVIRRLGLVGVLVLCLSLMAVRLAFYGALESPWPVLLVEGIHGITFALLWAAGTVLSAHPSLSLSFSLPPPSLPTFCCCCLLAAACCCLLLAA